MKLTLCAQVCIAMVSATRGQPPTIDGTLAGDEGAYGAALSMQNTGTDFGNAVSGDSVVGLGSEIDQIFARIDNERLYVLVAGNLENNFNKLEVFFDTQAGGHQQLNGLQLPGGLDGFCCPGSGALQRMNGLRFDTGFAADFYLTISHGTEFVEAVSPVPDSIPFWAASAHF